VKSKKKKEKEEKELEIPEENKIQQNQENINSNNINIIPPKEKDKEIKITDIINNNNKEISKEKVELDEELISKSSKVQNKLDLNLPNNDSKVQFAEGTSEKKLDFDFYHNQGKDSYLDLRALKNLEKIEFSDDSDEEEKIKKKKKKKLKKEKKEGEETDEDKNNKKRKYTDKEKKKAKIYKKGMHLLRKAIRSYKKRNNKNEYENRFKFWKNIIINSKLTKPEENNIIEEIQNKIDDKISTIELKNDTIKEIKENKEENNKESNKEEHLIEIINQEKEETINDNINNDSEKNLLNKEENKKDDKIQSIQNLIEINNKINNEIISLLKKTDEERFNEFEPEIFDKLLYENNKKILTYKLFCIYNNYNNSLSFRKKVYLKRWNKMK